jgi:hypothetical protein
MLQSLMVIYQHEPTTLAFPHFAALNHKLMVEFKISDYF